MPLFYCMENDLRSTNFSRHVAAVVVSAGGVFVGVFIRLSFCRALCQEGEVSSVCVARYTWWGR